MASVYNRGTKDHPNWYARYKNSDGKWVSTPTGQPTKTAAMVFAVEVEARIRRGLIGIPEPVSAQATEKPLTVGGLLEKFLDEYRSPTVRNPKRYRQQYSSCYRVQIAPHPLAAIPVDKVRPRDIEKLRDALDDYGYEPGTVNQALDLLSVAFRWAARQEIITSSSPVSSVARLSTEPSNDCYQLDEVHRLLSLPDLPPMVATALYTGARRGELCGLRWTDVRFDLMRIEIQRSYARSTKSGKPRVIPLHPELLPILRAWREMCPQTPEGHVFPICVMNTWRAATNSDERPADLLRTVLQRAHCRSDFKRPWHALRHTFATQFIEQHGSSAALERLLGHSTSGNRVTAGYVNVDLRFLATELARISLRPPPEAQIIPLSAHRSIA